MSQKFSYSNFLYRFPTNDECLEELKKLRYPNGVFCKICSKITKHYKIKGRSAYSCKYCRSQVFPMKGTILEKSTTPLRIWFYAMFIMTHSRAGISITQLQKELGVTYKTAWRMYRNIKIFMAQNNGDLLRDVSELDLSNQRQQSIHRWTFFSKLEITLTQKQENAE